MKTLLILAFLAVMAPQATAAPPIIWGPGPTAKLLAPLASPAGTVSLPGVTAGTDQTSGLYSLGTGDLGISTGGVLAIELYKHTDGVNIGIGVAASQSAGAAITAGYTINGDALYQFDNLSGGIISRTVFEIFNGPNGGGINNALLFMNAAYTTSGYGNSGNTIESTSNQTQFIIASDGGPLLFSVGGTTQALATANETMSLDLNHHVNFHNGTAPTVTSGCRSTPSVTGNDTVGVLNVGTGGSASTCTITFNKTFTTTPHCFVNDQSATIALKAVPSATTLVITAAAAFAASSLIDYHCINHY